MGDEDLKEIPDVRKSKPCKGSVGRTAPCASSAATFCLLVYDAHWS